MANRLATAALLVAASIAAPSAASAHAFLRTATPKVGSTVATAPKEVAIDFTTGVEPAFSSIVVTDSGGSRVDRGSPHLASGDNRLAVALKPLPPGRYLVTWHAIATDTHRTEGTFSFTVAP